MIKEYVYLEDNKPVFSSTNTPARYEGQTPCITIEGEQDLVDSVLDLLFPDNNIKYIPRSNDVELSYDGYTLDEFMSKVKGDCSNVETCSSKSLQDWKRTDAECTAELSTFNLIDYLSYYRIKTSISTF